MLAVTSTQLDAWIAAFVYPVARILALMLAAPVFSNRGVPRRIVLLIGLAVALALAPTVPPLPAVSPASAAGVLILAQQILIGIAMGFAVRIVFAAVDLAGELIGLQMGLSFAVFFDPGTSGQTPVVAEFFGLLATLIFLTLNAHLMMLAALSASFQLLPIDLAPVSAVSMAMLARWGTTIFAAGVLLALPLIAALLITNVALGVLTRAAPQLNLFAVGFPVTLMVGFGVLFLSLHLSAPVLERMFEQGLSALDQWMRVAGNPAPR